MTTRIGLVRSVFFTTGCQSEIYVALIVRDKQHHITYEIR